MLTHNSEMNFFAVSNKNELLVKPYNDENYNGYAMSAIEIDPNESAYFITELNLKKIVQNNIISKYISTNDNTLKFDYIWSYVNNNIKIYHISDYFDHVCIPIKYVASNELNINFSDIYKNKFKVIENKIKDIIEQEYLSYKYKNGYIVDKIEITDTYIHIISEHILKNIPGINISCGIIRTIIQDIIQKIKIFDTDVDDIRGYLNEKKISK